MTWIRTATKLDREHVRDVHLHAFSEGENRIVSTLAVNLLSEETSPETFALVAEIDGLVVGHIAFSPVTVDKNETWTGYILAPLGIKPAYQKRQIGSKLVESGMARLTKKGVNAVFVYGDPGYYGKFGFNADAASRYLPPYVLQYPSGWQAIVLKQAGSAALTFKLSCAASLCDPQLW